MVWIGHGGENLKASAKELPAAVPLASCLFSMFPSLFSSFSSDSVPSSFTPFLSLSCANGSKFYMGLRGRWSSTKRASRNLYLRRRQGDVRRCPGDSIGNGSSVGSASTMSSTAFHYCLPFSHVCYIALDSLLMIPTVVLLRPLPCRLSSCQQAV